MQFALVIPNWAPFTQELMIELALEAEALGYDHVFYTDHLMNPYAERDNLPEETVETWCLISHVAAKTSRIRLGTAVSPISLRPPGLLAKQVATVDNLSGGRINLGVGVGWAPGSFGVVDAGFGTKESRIGRMREGIELITRLWTEESVTFEGDYYRVENAIMAPKPVQKPHPPLWIGGWKKHSRQVAAEMGQGWIPWNLSPEQFDEAQSSLREQADALGRADQITYAAATLVLPDRLGNERDIAIVHGKEPPHVTVSTLGPAVEAYAAAGADLFAAFPFPATDAVDIVRGLARQFL